MEKQLPNIVLKQMFEVVPKSDTLKNQGRDALNYSTFDQHFCYSGTLIKYGQFCEPPSPSPPPPPKKLFKLPYSSGIIRCKV
jgi:hypothetical protein